MTDNLISNSRTEVINGEICLIVTSERIELVAEQMKNAIASEVNYEEKRCK